VDVLRRCLEKRCSWRFIFVAGGHQGCSWTV